MQLFLLNILPPGVFIISIVLMIGILVALTFFLVKRYAPAGLKKEPQSFLQPLIEVVSTSYAVLLGFLIITAWSWFLQAQEGTYEEAASLSTLTYYALNLPSPIQNEALDAIGNYIKSVTEDEWPLQRSGKTSTKTQETLNHLFQVFHSFCPTLEAEKIFHTEISKNLSDLVQKRFIRISKLDSILIVPIRLSLFFGMILISFLFSLYQSKRWPFHLLTLVVFTSILSFNIALALLLDYPYSGQFAVSSKAFSEGILARFQCAP